MPPSTDKLNTRSISSSILGVLLVLVVAFVVIALLFGNLSFFGLFRAPSAPPTFELVFSKVSIDSGGNASWIVDSVDGGPYPYVGFSMRLAVNGTSTIWVRLGQNDKVQSVVVEMVTYRIVWGDADANGLLSKGDPFSVTGDKAPLPSRSAFEFVVKWHELWLSQAFWSTG